MVASEVLTHQHTLVPFITRKQKVRIRLPNVVKASQEASKQIYSHLSLKNGFCHQTGLKPRSEPPEELYSSTPRVVFLHFPDRTSSKCSVHTSLDVTLRRFKLNNPDQGTEQRLSHRYTSFVSLLYLRVETFSWFPPPRTPIIHS